MVVVGREGSRNSGGTMKQCRVFVFCAEITKNWRRGMMGQTLINVGVFGVRHHLTLGAEGSYVNF